MTHPVHQFAEVRARVGREGVAGVAQVVEMRSGRAFLLYGLDPEAVVEVAVLQRLTGRAGEDERVVVLADVGGQVVAQLCQTG